MTPETAIERLNNVLGIAPGNTGSFEAVRPLAGRGHHLARCVTPFGHVWQITRPLCDREFAQACHMIAVGFQIGRGKM